MRDLRAGIASVVTVFTASTASAFHSGLLDGDVTVANSGAMNPTSDFTVEAWIRPTAFYFNGPTESSYQGIIYKWSGGGTNQRCYLLNVFEDQLEFAFSLDGGSLNHA